MTSTATVFSVSASGATGTSVARGMLVAPRVVLIAPEVAERLTGDHVPRLRVAVGDGPALAVLDDPVVHRLADEGTSEGWVALELDRPVLGDTEPLSGDSRSALLEAAAKAFASTPQVQGPPWVPGSGEQNNNPWCRLFGIGCHSKPRD
jgi:hypothetical protein